jgi:hypothetical protein
MSSFRLGRSAAARKRQLCGNQALSCSGQAENVPIQTAQRRVDRRKSRLVPSTSRGIKIGYLSSPPRS